MIHNASSALGVAKYDFASAVPPYRLSANTLPGRWATTPRMASIVSDETTAEVSSLVSRRTAAGESDGWLQQVDPSVDDGFVLRMERTASLEVTVLGPRGNPVPEAVVSLSPNVAWSSGGTGLFLDRTWTRPTGADGVALIENLPPEPVELYWVRHPGLRMPEEPATGENARRLGIVELVSGLTTREEIRLEERDGD